jgi:hypothetical protein
METQTTAPKKARALPRVWAPFHRLKTGENFYLGSTDNLVQKTGWFTRTGHQNWQARFFVWPWKKVRTTVYVRDVLKGGKTTGGQVTEAAKEAYPTTTVFKSPTDALAAKNPLACEGVRTPSNDRGC